MESLQVASQKRSIYFNFCQSCYWSATSHAFKFLRCPRCDGAVYRKKVRIEVREIPIP
jgi:hypothetical protein